MILNAFKQRISTLTRKQKRTITSLKRQIGTSREGLLGAIADNETDPETNQKELNRYRNGNINNIRNNNECNKNITCTSRESKSISAEIEIDITLSKAGSCYKDIQLAELYFSVPISIRESAEAEEDSRDQFANDNENDDKKPIARAGNINASTYCFNSELATSLQRLQCAWLFVMLYCTSASRKCFTFVCARLVFVLCACILMDVKY